MVIDYEGISKLLDVRNVDRKEEFLAKFIGELIAAIVRREFAEIRDMTPVSLHMKLHLQGKPKNCQRSAEALQPALGACKDD